MSSERYFLEEQGQVVEVGFDRLELMVSFDQAEAGVYNRFASVAGAMGEKDADADDPISDMVIADGMIHQRREFNPLTVERDGRAYTVVLGEYTLRPFGDPHARSEITSWMSVNPVDGSEEDASLHVRPQVHFLPGREGDPRVGLSDPSGFLDEDDDWCQKQLAEQAEYKAWIDLAYEAAEQRAEEDGDFLL